jgi:chromosomal replication initiator protein
MTQYVSFPDPRPAPAASDVTAARIIEATAAMFGVTTRELLSDRRDSPLVSARHAAMWLARKMTVLGYPGLGRAFKRDHSTVMYGVARASERMHQDSIFAGRVHALEATIGRPR